ncbi:hypothetical protein K461DRAFT_280033 [Myriangium duriaei CBS 260.36]|uniref:Rhodopsin domain-containing protein n=1 Tax=Myriangium duriaei CBS 260.36 TaxID=1168546 RepID=A0A9P4IX39_9PEZI|nr:hypothetical protein K461DRAFT_280033 [Myriangium duriaei CBS 260.36]
MASMWEVPLVLTMVLIRAAIATFFLRVLPKEDNRAKRLIIHAIFWVYAVFMLTFMFVNVFQCGNPLKKEYNYRPYCLNGKAEDILPIVVRIVTMVLDWLMTMVPVVVVVRSASLSIRSKLSVICLMLLAGAGSTVSVLTIVYNDLGTFHGPQSFSTFMIYTMLSLAENAVAIIVVSLAALRPLFRKIFGNSSQSPRSSANQQIWFSQGATFRNAPPPAAAYHADNVVLLNGWDANAKSGPSKQSGTIHTQPQHPYFGS